MANPAPPYCNLNSVNGEFFSIKQDKYDKDVKENEKQKKVFIIGLGSNIFFFIVFVGICIALYSKNKSNLQNSEQNAVPISPWTPGVIITLIIAILCILSMCFTGYKTISLNKGVPKPVIDDEIRPCYSKEKKEILQPIPSSQPGSPASGITSTIATQNTGALAGQQKFDSTNLFSGSGLEQLDLSAEFNQLQGSSNMGTGSTLTTVDTTGTGRNFSFDQNQTSTNSANAGSTSSANQGRRSSTETSGNAGATSSTSGSSSVQFST